MPLQVAPGVADRTGRGHWWGQLTVEDRCDCVCQIADLASNGEVNWPNLFPVDAAPDLGHNLELRSRILPAPYPLTISRRRIR